MSTGGSQVFADLPAALIEDALQLAADIGQQILEELELATKQRDAWRKGMENAGVIRHEADLPNVQVPTTCGVDGSYAIERLLGIDLVGVAAVAVDFAADNELALLDMLECAEPGRRCDAVVRPISSLRVHSAGSATSSLGR